MTLTHRERILKAVWGGRADVLPFTPRLDIWYNANTMTGTLPRKHQGKSLDQIALDEGWAFHKNVPDLLNIRTAEDTIHQALGIYSLKEMVFKYQFSKEVEVRYESKDNRQRVEYSTPVGTISTETEFPDSLRRSGSTISIIREYAIKCKKDYKPLSYIFANLELIPDFTDFTEWKDEIGPNGVAYAHLGQGCSPMHHIQKHFLDPTQFIYHYKDYPKEMAMLVESLSHYFEQAMQIIAESPAEAVYWGANIDAVLTPPPYFEKEIMPWIKRGSELLEDNGKFVSVHCDGENFGLIDLLAESGLHVAEAICPYPMTKIPIEQYYKRWKKRLTIQGGIPSTILLAETTSDEEFKAYLDHLFRAIVPGDRFILAVADTTPPNAVFDRLVRIGERVRNYGHLPLNGYAIKRKGKVDNNIKTQEPIKLDQTLNEFQDVMTDVLDGDNVKILKHVCDLLEKGVSSKDILHNGMLPAMEIIGQRFKDGTVFIPEVILSARAMNAATLALEPYLLEDDSNFGGRVLIGTVKGDLHDIGKNMVVSMIRGAGFEIYDLGMDVQVNTFVEKVAELKPDILGLSALLTTTMPEMAKVIKALYEAGTKKHVKVIVGGAPVNLKYAEEIGADGYAEDAPTAVGLVRKMIIESNRKTNKCKI